MAGALNPSDIYKYFFGPSVSSPTSTPYSPSNILYDSFGQMRGNAGTAYTPPAGATPAEKESFFKNLLYTDGKLDITKAGGILGGIGGLTGMFDPQSAPQGYQGGIPDYTAVRAPVERANDPNRRPGSMGRRYFSDVSFQSPSAVDTAPALNQATGLASIDPVVRRQAARPDLYPTPIPTQTMAAGGILGLKEGKYLAGASDGMADQVPATVDNVEPAALSDGEYVIPADVVSHLGNGNSDAGAKVLDGFLLKVRKERTGNDKQGKQIDPNKLLPA